MRRLAKREQHLTCTQQHLKCYELYFNYWAPSIFQAFSKNSKMSKITKIYKIVDNYTMTSFFLIALLLSGIRFSVPLGQYEKG